MKPKMVKAMSLGDMIGEVASKAAEAQKEFEENGGMCLHCGKNPGDPTSPTNSFHCTKCNAETEALHKQLRGPGFMELRIPVPRKS